MSKRSLTIKKLSVELLSVLDVVIKNNPGMIWSAHNITDKLNFYLTSNHRLNTRQWASFFSRFQDKYTVIRVQKCSGARISYRFILKE